MVGVCRLTMKRGRDSFRVPASRDVMKRIGADEIPAMLYESALEDSSILFIR